METNPVPPLLIIPWIMAETSKMQLRMILSVGGGVLACAHVCKFGKGTFIEQSKGNAHLSLEILSFDVSSQSPTMKPWSWVLFLREVQTKEK